MRIRRALAAIFVLILGMYGGMIPVRGAELPARVLLNPAEEYALARFCAAETEGEPFLCRLAVAAALLNRLEDPRYPDTISGILADGGYRAAPVTDADRASALWAVRVAGMGVDPTSGALCWGRAGTVATRGMEIRLAAGRMVFGVR